VGPGPGALWTVDDLTKLPDDGKRYEIFDGSLLVSPAPDTFHFRAVLHLSRLLDRSAPPDLVASGIGVGVLIRSGRSYYVPDITVLRRSVLAVRMPTIDPADVLLVVEVLSPGNAGKDLITKRHDYAVAGIPWYWIVDQEAETVTVLTLDGSGRRYAEEAVIKAGDTWRTAEPFPLVLDPTEIF
jgi:Uma2 family endonuclease